MKFRVPLAHIDVVHHIESELAASKYRDDVTIDQHDSGLKVGFGRLSFTLRATPEEKGGTVYELIEEKLAPFARPFRDRAVKQLTAIIKERGGEILA